MQRPLLASFIAMLLLFHLCYADIIFNKNGKNQGEEKGKNNYGNDDN